MGSALRITLPNAVTSTSGGDRETDKEEKVIRLAVKYSTTKESTALQWLDKEYVFTIFAPSSSLPRRCGDQL